MKKQDEITLLTNCANSLGADSYCGEWLREQIPNVQAEIAADCIPGTFRAQSYAQMRKDAEETKRNAESHAADIIAKAETQAKLIVSEADRRAADIETRIANYLRKELVSLGFGM